MGEIVNLNRARKDRARADARASAAANRAAHGRTRADRDKAEAGLKKRELWAVVEASPGASARVEEGGQASVEVRYTRGHDQSVEALDIPRSMSPPGSSSRCSPGLSWVGLTLAPPSYWPFHWPVSPSQRGPSTGGSSGIGRQIAPQHQRSAGCLAT